MKQLDRNQSSFRSFLVYRRGDRGAVTDSIDGVVAFSRE